MLAVATLIAVLDSIASQAVSLEAVLGTGEEAGTISGAAASNRTTLAALDDADVQSDLTPVFSQRVALVSSRAIMPAMQGNMIQRALDTHYGSGAGLNRVLADNDLRVHPHLRKVGMQIDSSNVFLPTVLDPVARYEGSGAGSGLFVAGSDVDKASFGKAAMEVVVEAMGASARTLRLSMRKQDSTLEDRDVAVPANTAPDTPIRIGAGADRYIGVANITTTDGGGTAADRFRVRTIVERVLPAL